MGSILLPLKYYTFLSSVQSLPVAVPFTIRPTLKRNVGTYSIGIIRGLHTQVCVYNVTQGSTFVTSASEVCKFLRHGKGTLSVE